MEPRSLGPGQAGPGELRLGRVRLSWAVAAGFGSALLSCGFTSSDDGFVLFKAVRGLLMRSAKISDIKYNGDGGQWGGWGGGEELEELWSRDDYSPL